MLSMYKFRKVRDLIKEGYNNVEIANKVAIDRKTVRKYRQTNTPPSYGPRQKKHIKDNFDQFKDIVLNILGKNQLCKKGNFKKDEKITTGDIFELISAQGYTGSERTLFRRIKALKEEMPKERYYEQQYSPAEQSQFDFKESVPIPFKDGIKTINLFFATLPFSDRFFIKGFTYKKYEAFIDGMHSFFIFIDGMTECVRIDNLSPCVRKVLKGDKRLYTKDFQKAIDYYGFKVLPCSPGKGNEKGDVERDIRTHARKIQSLIKIHGLCFESLTDFNHWLYDYAVNRQKKDSEVKFIEEKSLLMPLPRAEESILNEIDYLRASGYGTIHHEGAIYSVPDTAMGGQVLKTVISAEEVKIYKLDGEKKLVARHPRQPKTGKSIEIAHIIHSLIRKPGALARWKHKDILFQNASCKRLFCFLKKHNPEKAEKEFLKTINLIQHVPLTEIATAIDIALEGGSNDLFEDIKILVLPKEGYSEGIVQAINQPSIKPNLNQYDLFIPS